MGQWTVWEMSLSLRANMGQRTICDMSPNLRAQRAAIDISQGAISPVRQ